MKAVLFCLFALVALVAGTTVDRDVLFTRFQPASGWQMLGRAKATDKVTFTIGLKQRNMDKLHKIVEQITDPKHPEYQNYMSIKAINAMVAPAKKDKQQVISWLTKSGIMRTQIKDLADSLDVSTNVKTAEKLFQTAMHYYAHKTEGTVVVKNFGQYSVPKKVSKYIDIVAGLSTFPVPHLTAKKRSQRKGGKGAPMDTVGIVAQSIAALYNLPSSQTTGSAPQTSVGVIEFQGQNFAPADSDAYAQSVGIQIVDVPANQTIGPNDPTNPQTEAELDIQMVQTVNTETSPWFWLESGQGWLYQFGTHFFSTQAVPQVNSISYGWWEGDQCTIDPDECQALGVSSEGYVNAVNAQFAKIAARGIALISASGDSGANGRTDPDCTTPQLRAAFPGSSPYVTTVGATQINNPVPLPTQPAACTNSGLSCPQSGQEVAVSYDVASFASGGGFSNYAATPTWQKSAVQAYLNSGVALPPASYFNSTGRGAPDIAAVGHNNIIEQSGQLEPVGGTSASAPINAAIIGLLNQAVLAKTGKPLGFLNPFLYQAYADNPLNFNDVTIGDNKCTEDGCSASCQGFVCTKGWDPVTGLGSLNYGNLLNYINSEKFAPHKATAAWKAAHATKKHHHHNKKH